MLNILFLIKELFMKQETILNQQRMTSLEIAEITGKPHGDVMKAIRKMEPSWAKVSQGNFSLASYNDAQGKTRPCYSLTKTECLYVATKFNDEARAKLVLRWEELERESRAARAESRDLSDMEILCRAVVISDKHIKELTAKVEELSPKALYCDEVLDSVSCLTTTQIAKELEMSAHELNRWLCEQGIQYRQSGQYMLYANYAERGLAQNRSYSYRASDGKLHTLTYLVWTERGRRFIHQRMKSLTSRMKSLEKKRNIYQDKEDSQYLSINFKF